MKFNLNKQGYSDFNNKLEKFLTEKYKNIVPIGDITKYYDPLSNEHIYFLKKQYQINGIKPNDVTFYFARFVWSWFNSGYRNDIKNKDYNEIAQLCMLFDLQSFSYKYGKDISLLEYEIKTKPIYDALRKLSKNRMNQFCRGLIDIANWLNSNQATFNKKITYNDFDSYFCQVNGIISKKNINLIYGYGKALFSDAVKESGIIDLAKPDIHIIDVINAVFNTKQLDPDKDYKELLKIFYDMSQATNYSVYKLDKMIWLACAHFYLDGENKTIKDYKSELIKVLTM